MALFDDTRADWGARKPQGPIYTVPIASRTEKFAHWNGGPLGIANAKSHTTCLSAVKAIQAEHMHDDPAHNWSDIGYNALICPAHARLIEGRGRDAVGAHCPNHNRSGIAVQFMLGEGETATAAMYARARKFFDDCEAAARHTLRPMGHRDGYATECPGDQIEAWVKAGMSGAQEDDMPLTAADAKTVWDTDLTLKGTIGGADSNESPLDILTRVARNVEAVAALTKVQADQVAAAVVAAQVAAKQPTVDVDALARAIVVQLTKGA